MNCANPGAALALALGLCAGAAIDCAAAQRSNNVVLFIGDGMGISTVTAARIFAGQQQGGNGEEHQLSFEAFPHVALVKTYNTDAQVPDSAGTMTALMTGKRTRAGVIGIGPQARRGDCAAGRRHVLATLLEEAEQRGLRTGIVSTTRLTHATPAAAYAHAAERGWEADSEVPEALRGDCPDIARQFVEFAYGDGVDVMLGGGAAMFLPAAGGDSSASGRRADGRDLVAEWLAGRPDRHFVEDRAGLEALPAGGQVFGLFAPSHMAYEADRDRAAHGEPSLAQMTRVALERLRGASGFLLIVEGGRIDHAHHETNAYRALVDTVAFDAAVAVAADMTDAADTLLIVTADHSHTLTIAGYPARGNPILGYVADADGTLQTDDDGDPYTTLAYANGPGAARARAAHEHGHAQAQALEPTHPDYLQTGTHPLQSETHGGEDVAAYARGIGARGIRGVMEQYELHTVMRRVLLGGGAADARPKNPRQYPLNQPIRNPQ